MLDGHFDYGNGYHGRVYLNPHQLFRHPSTIWRFAQDLLDVAAGAIVDSAPKSWPGPVTGGALLAHTIAGLLDSRRSLTHPPCSSRRSSTNGKAADAAAVLPAARQGPARAARRRRAEHRADVRRDAPALVREAGGTVLATVEIYDRLEAIVDPGVPNIALAEYKAPANYPAGECPLCKAGKPITTF